MPRARYVVHPSEVGGCERALGLSTLSVPTPDADVDANQQRWFHVGHQAHQRIQGYLWEATTRGVGGLTRFWEDVEIQYPELAVRGELDGLIEIAGEHRYVVEVKSAGRKHFDALFEPKEEWLCQVYLYMRATGVLGAVVVAECKDSQRQKDWFVPFQEERWHEIEAKIIRVLRGIRSRRLAVVDTSYCHFCRYHNYCEAKGGSADNIDWTDVDKIDWSQVVL